MTGPGDVAGQCRPLRVVPDDETRRLILDVLYGREALVAARVQEILAGQGHDVPIEAIRGALTGL